MTVTAATALPLWDTDYPLFEDAAETPAEETPALTLTVTAYAVTEGRTADTVNWDRPQHFRVHTNFGTREEAEAFAALFPKAAKLRVVPVGASMTAPSEQAMRDRARVQDPRTLTVTPTDMVIDGQTWFQCSYFTVSADAKLVEDGVNGGRNETGVKRYATLMRAAAKAGVTVTWDAGDRCMNAYRTREQFEAAV